MAASGLPGVEFIAMDFDMAALISSKANIKHELRSLYPPLTFPEFGDPARMRDRQSAMARRSEIRQEIGNADAIVIVAGLGGGTGSGVTPIVLEVIKEKGALAFGVVTLPFSFEGEARQKIAREVVKELCSSDMLTVISADMILHMPGIAKTGVDDAFSLLDDVLDKAVRHMLDFITAGLPPEWLKRG
jgi:cell division protein FtsZ